MQESNLVLCQPKIMNIEQKVRELIAEEISLDIDEVTLNANLEYDLGCDSLDTVEIIIRLEEEFDIEISDEAAESVKTVGQAVDLVTKLTEGKDGTES